MNKRHLLRTTVLALSSLLLAGTAQAQDFPPKKPITLVVGFAAGGAADAAARLIARKLGENIGQTILVDNKAGAGGNIAHQQVAAGLADGTVLLLGSVGPLTIAPHMMKLPYDPFKDLAPITGGVYFPNLLVVHPGAGIKTMADFTAAVKKAPNNVSYASTGNGSASHLAGELFASRAGVDMLHVPYRGGAPAMQDLLAGRFTGYFSAPPTSLPHIEAGQRLPRAPPGRPPPADRAPLPPGAASGDPGFEALNWYAFVGSSKMPAALLDRYNLEIVKVLNDPAIREALTKHGLSAHPTTRAELNDFMHKESVKWEKIVRERNIKPE